MKSAGKVLAGILLVAALFCIARVIMYGVGSLPFMDRFNTTSATAGSESKPAGTTTNPSAGTPPPSNAAPQTYSSSPTPSRPAASQPSSVPNPPSMYERARRAGNRPNNGQDE